MVVNNDNADDHGAVLEFLSLFSAGNKKFYGCRRMLGLCYWGYLIWNKILLRGDQIKIKGSCGQFNDVSENVILRRQENWGNKKLNGNYFGLD